MENNNELISNYLCDEVHTINNLNINEIAKVYAILDECLKEKKTVYVFGNGGSGSTASHMVNDFNKAVFEKTNNRFDFRCLNDNIPTLLAVANDIGYDEIFRYQLMGRLTKEDVVIAISGSGNSKNIINATDYAKKVGSKIIGFTGYDGGMLKKIADYSLDSNIDNMQITEDIHLMLEHLLISLFYQRYGMKKYKNLVLK